MAEVIGNQSKNVVSKNKSDACDNTKSNSVLIDLGEITASGSELIRVHDNEDEAKCILINSAKDELNMNEKNLHELIENELALRICSSNELGTIKLVSSSNPGSRDGINGDEPMIDMSVQLGENFPSFNVNFIEKEVECSNVSHEFSTHQEQNIDKSLFYNNSMDNILDDNKPVASIGINFCDIPDDDDNDTLNGFQRSKSFENDKLIDELKSMTDSVSSIKCETDKFGKNQHPIKNTFLNSECHGSPNKVEITQSLDGVIALSNDTDTAGPLMPFDIVRVESIMALENNNLEPMDDMQDISTLAKNDSQKIIGNVMNDDIILKRDEIENIQFSTTQQYISDNEFHKVTESDDTNIHLVDVIGIIDAAKPDTIVTTLINEINNPIEVFNTSAREKCMPCAVPVFELPILDEVTSNELFNVYDHEIHEEVITASSTIISTGKNSVKLKKKKSDGIAGNDGLPTSTPRTKKTKKTKKNDLEKENISVNINNGDMGANMSNNGDYLMSGKFSNVDDLSNVNVKSLTQCYAIVSSKHGVQEKCGEETIATGISINSLKSSFNKFDALSKKTILNVRSLDTPKIQQQSNLAAQNTDINPNCRSCEKVVFQMEQTKAESLIWHKNCFRCVQCSKQLSVDNYQSHESILYCKAHFKELFQPKPVDESNQPVCPQKPEMIIRENQPKELPPDVVRACDKLDLGLEELASLNVKSRFQVFEKKTESEMGDIERSSSQISVKRSPSILSKLARFQAKGMDIGVADESLNGIPYEESSESDEEGEMEEIEDVDTEIIKSKRTTRERPMSFSKMDDMKNRWEITTQQGRRESQREARKEEIAGIRSRLFMGKQGKMKEMYQQAVATSERVMKINPVEEIQYSTHARSIKERFERGDPVADADNLDENKVKQDTPDEDVIAAGISRKSRTLFLELDASVAKAGGGPPVTPVSPKIIPESSRRARDMNSPEREIYRDPDVIRADDRLDEMVHTDTTKKMLSIFRQMEEKATKEDVPDGPKPLKRFTPPPEDKYAKTTASDSEEEGEEYNIESGADSGEEERNPNYVRASDKVEDEFLKQAPNAVKAKTLRAKFEQWETNDEKMAGHNITTEMEMAQITSGEHTSIESARSLRARFESLGAQPAEVPRTLKCKVNRFVDTQTVAMDVCDTCQKKVYPLEKIEANKKIFHKHCFRCLQCNCILRMDTFTLNNGKLYCIPHFKQLFIARGNYDEGFGVDPHKNKWSTNFNSGSNTDVTSVVVTNGGPSQITNHN